MAAEARNHVYSVTVTWTGNHGQGTSGYTAYGRDHVISAPGKPAISGSSDPAFRGDGTRWNPEELFLAALSACHKLWYLHLCAEAGIRVLTYVDECIATMEDNGLAGGRFTGATLRPAVTMQPGHEVDRARAPHQTAHEKCFLANSVNFPVQVVPAVEAA
jgi:organic hydroperoxide reductase OsmC/OhrA